MLVGQGPLLRLAVAATEPELVMQRAHPELVVSLVSGAEVRGVFGAAPQTTTYTTTYIPRPQCRCQVSHPFVMGPPLGSLPFTSQRSRYTCAFGRGANIKHGQQAQAQTDVWYLKGTADSYVRRPTYSGPVMLRPTNN